MNESASSPVSVLLITGTVGVGKTVLARDVAQLFRLSGVRGAMIDLDALSYVCSGNVPDEFNSDFVLRNLKAIWPNYAARGARYLVLARYVGSISEVARYKEAVPFSDLTVCRVVAPPDTVRERLMRREVGCERDFLATLSQTLADRGDALAVEDFVVENGPGRSITELAREVATRAGWALR